MNACSTNGVSQQLGLEGLEGSTSPAERDRLAAQYIRFHPTLRLLQYAADGAQPQAYLSKDLSDLRTADVETFATPHFFAAFSVHDAAAGEATANMEVTALVLVVFAAASVLISRDVHELVVAPLERTTNVIKRLAGTVCLLTASTEEEQRQLTEGYACAHSLLVAVGCERSLIRGASLPLLQLRDGCGGAGG